MRLSVSSSATPSAPSRLLSPRVALTGTPPRSPASSRAPSTLSTSRSAPSSSSSTAQSANHASIDAAAVYSHASRKSREVSLTSSTRSHPGGSSSEQPTPPPSSPAPPPPPPSSPPPPRPGPSANFSSSPSSTRRRAASSAASANSRRSGAFARRPHPGDGPFRSRRRRPTPPRAAAAAAAPPPAGTTTTLHPIASWASFKIALAGSRRYCASSCASRLSLLSSSPSLSILAATLAASASSRSYCAALSFNARLVECALTASAGAGAPTARNHSGQETISSASRRVRSSGANFRREKRSRTAEWSAGGSQGATLWGNGAPRRGPW